MYDLIRSFIEDRFVGYHMTGSPAKILKRKRIINDRLDTGTRLLVLLGRVIQQHGTAASVVPAAADGNDLSRVIVHGYDTAFHEFIREHNIRVLVFLYRVYNFLNPRIHIRVDIHGYTVRILTGQVLYFRDHRVYIGLIGIGSTAGKVAQRINKRIFNIDGQSQLIFISVDISVSQHHLQYGISPVCGIVQIVVWIIPVRGVDHTRKHCAFRKIQFTGMFAVIVFRSFLNTADIPGTAEVHLVQV